MPQPCYPSDLSDQERTILEPLLSSAVLSRKAWPSAEVAVETRGKRSVLPPEERMFVADAASRVPAVADSLLPLP